jgi:hypothetical protein
MLVDSIRVEIFFKLIMYYLNYTFKTKITYLSNIFSKLKTNDLISSGLISFSRLSRFKIHLNINVIIFVL